MFRDLTLTKTLNTRPNNHDDANEQDSAASEQRMKEKKEQAARQAAEELAEQVCPREELWGMREGGEICVKL